MPEFPPLNPLHVFTVVARCRSVARAAAELGVTQSAVSRQVSALERHFGCKLFRRTRYGLDVLPVADELAQESAAAFEQVGRAARRFMTALGSAEQHITIKTYTSFAVSWLIPRLPEFCRLHPNIKIGIKTGAKFIDFGKQEGDLAIQIIGKKPVDEFNASLLYQDVIEPVCSPAFFERHAPSPNYPSSLLRQTVIATEYRDFDWKTWLERSGYADDYAPGNVLNLGNAKLAWDAAASGIGLAMGQTRMLADKLKSGQLVTPFRRPVNTEKCYFVVLPRTQAKAGALLFRDWLVQQF